MTSALSLQLSLEIVERLEVNTFPDMLHACTYCLLKKGGDLIALSREIFIHGRYTVSLITRAQAFQTPSTKMKNVLFFQ